MSTPLVTLSIAIVGSQAALATGETFAQVQVSVTDAAGNTQTQEIPASAATGTTLSASFSGVAPGAGTVTVEAQDASGNVLGSAVSQAYDTEPAEGTFFQPSSITVSVGS